jgi:hypothetical protein
MPQTASIGQPVETEATRCGSVDQRAIMPSKEPEMDLAQRCEREIVELHAFFERWFNGGIERSEASLARFTDVLAPGFHIVSPDGAVRDRATIIGLVRDGYGSGVEDGQSTTRIWIEHLALRAASDRVAIVTYDEWQERGGEHRGRRSTAVLQTARDTPNELRWLHVHETWIAEGE